MEVMKALYPPEGGTPKAFACCEKIVWWEDGMVERKRTCGKVTRTVRGMWAHLRKVHGIVKQGRLFIATDRPIQSDTEGLRA